mgnify:CR=1 FL=1
MWARRTLLAGYLLGVALVASCRPRHDAPAASGGAVAGTLQGYEWIAAPVLDALGWGVACFLAGLMLPWCLGAAGRLGRPWIRTAVLAALGLTVVASLVAVGSPTTPGWADLLVSWAACLIGAWLGAPSAGGWKASIRRIAVRTGAVGGALAACTAGLALLALDSEPLAIEPVVGTAAEKHRLAQLLTPADAHEETWRLTLGERDANLLLALALGDAWQHRKARVRFGQGAVTVDLSRRTTFRPPRLRYVNLQVVGQIDIRAGQMRLTLERLRVGSLELPSGLVRRLSVGLVSALARDEELRCAVDATELLRVRPGVVEIATRKAGFRKELIPAVVERLNGRPSVVSAARIQVRHLLAASGNLPRGDARLVALLQRSFALAKERSRLGDPVLENRAAILALAILLGHEGIEPLVGPVIEDELRQAARHGLGRVPLRGRRDWTRHFFVSAALALLSSAAVSDRLGVFKEEADADTLGSGFSFGDLLADRAGVRFALAATRDEPSARCQQERLAAGFSLDELFPEAADLPEGISDAELHDRYGGVGGEGYQAVMREMDRRLARCAALR